MTSKSYTAEPFAGLRKQIAKNMTKSHMVPRVTHHVDVDLSRLLEAKKALSEDGVSISIEDFILFFYVNTLRDYPDFNAITDGASITRVDVINVGFAVDVDGGLMVPAILNADQMSIEEISISRRSLVERARAGKLRAEEITNGTTTVSNVGHTRVQHFTPLINAPQTAILGLGRAKSVVRLADSGEPYSGKELPLSLSFDHRAIDGAPAGMFLTDLCEALERADF